MNHLVYVFLSIVVFILVLPPHNTLIESIDSYEMKHGAHVRILTFDERNSYDDNKDTQSETCNGRSKLSSGSESDHFSLSNCLDQRSPIFYLEDEDENKVILSVTTAVKQQNI